MEQNVAEQARMTAGNSSSVESRQTYSSNVEPAENIYLYTIDPSNACADSTEHLQIIELPSQPPSLPQRISLLVKKHWFLLGLAVVIVLASIWPYAGSKQSPLNTDILVGYVVTCLIFFLSGLGLKTKVLKKAFVHWRLILLVCQSNPDPNDKFRRRTCSCIHTLQDPHPGKIRFAADSGDNHCMLHTNYHRIQRAHDQTIGRKRSSCSRQRRDWEHYGCIPESAAYCRIPGCSCKRDRFILQHLPQTRCDRCRPAYSRPIVQILPPGCCSETANGA
jgi:SBF-like CPA transporter family (DUF4137)